MGLARTSVPTELRCLGYLLFNSAIPTPILLRLLRLVTADVTLPLQKRSTFMRVVTLVTAVTPQKSPGGGKVSHAPTRASSLILTEGYGRLRKVTEAYF